MMREDFKVRCPYCAEKIWMEFYREEGDDQEMIVDCEVCCQPILYRIRFMGDSRPEINISRSD